MIEIPNTKLININEIKIDKTNPNKMTEEQLESLVNTIKKYGWLVPIITNKELVIADGEHRLKAAQRLGLKEVPTIILDIEEVDRRILRQVMNKLKGEHQEDEDRLEFMYLNEQGKLEDLKDLLALSDKQYNNLQNSILEENPEEELNLEKDIEVNVSKGDIWELGRHRLMCGDATDKQDINNLMNGNKADMVFTDPPYGVDYSSKNEFLNKFDKGNCIQEPIINDAIKDYNKFFKEFLEQIREHLSDYNSFYITISGQKLLELLEELEKLDMKQAQILVWAKNNHVLGRQDYANKHELIVYGWYNHHKWYGKFGTTILEVDKPVKSDLHPTMKPIELINKLIENSSLQGHIILDVFGGSGSTLIACEQTKRTCYMMELDERYCQVIINRWEAYTKNKAKKVIE